MRSILLLFAAALMAGFLLSGCAGHQPLPRLRYDQSAPVGHKPDLPVSIALVTGTAVGHSLTTYALMPGGWAMPITSGPSPAGAFNAEDQAAFVENLVRVMSERGVLHRAAASETEAAKITIQFLKTEHFPEMQDYALDVLVATERADTKSDKVYHISTIDSVNVVSRMFQNGIDGRRRAAELLLAAVVPDLENWLLTGASAAPGDIEFVIPEAFDLAGPRCS